MKSFFQAIEDGVMTILTSLVGKRTRRRGVIEDRVGPLADASVEGLTFRILLMPFNHLGRQLRPELATMHPPFGTGLGG
jgi:hypothetical protein